MSGKYIEEDKTITCSVSNDCGGCCYTKVPYDKTLSLKQKHVTELFRGVAECEKITGMYRPVCYRNKVHAAVGTNRDGRIITGTYKEGTHKIIPVDGCMIEDAQSENILKELRRLFQSFKYQPYNEDTKRGFIRHVLIRRGFSTDETMVVLVTGQVQFPSKNAFIKELLKACPSVTTIVQNINNMSTSMVLGKRNIVIYGKGYIEDVLCSNRFRISPDSFYQINVKQTEKLYKAAIKAAGINKNDTVVDAYCGIGTIGITAAKYAGKVIGIELNPKAVEDAQVNAQINNIKNIRFFEGDAGDFLVEYARNKKADVVIMDPPRSGSDEAFLKSLIKIKPRSIVYISCNPDTQIRDVKKLTGYFDDIIASADEELKNDYVSITLRDEEIIPDVKKKLGAYFDYILEVVVDNSETRKIMLEDVGELKEMSPYDAFDTFFEQLTDRKMNDAESELFREILSEVGEE